MTLNRKILIVDDDASLRHSLAEQLQLHEEFAAVEAASASEALHCIKGQYHDAVLLDVGLPDMDGRELCRLMRREGVRAPILMLTGADSDADTVLGLDSGANDYITKPFRLHVLSPGCAPSCASTSRARTPSSPSAPIPSGRAPSCWSTTPSARRSGSPRRKPRS